MKNEYFNQKICCHVKNCKYYDNNEEKCNLGSITVVHESAICESFKEKKN